MLIGFAGKRTAGKTHAARILIREFSYAQARFAAPIKRALQVSLGLTWEHTDGDLKEVPCAELGGKTPRDAMEWFGMGAREKFGDDVWVNAWFRTNGSELRRIRQGGSTLHAVRGFVFEDVRLPNEAVAIQKHGGIVVRIRNDRADALPVLQSERALDDIVPDMTLTNDMGPNFERAVYDIADQLRMNRMAASI